VNVVKIPKGLSLKHAAITEPTANALKACNAAEIKKRINSSNIGLRSYWFNCSNVM